MKSKKYDCQTPLIGIYLILLIFIPVLVAPVEMETHLYIESTGSKEVPIEWKFEKGVVSQLTWLALDETITTWNSSSLETVKWVVVKLGQNTHITAQRINNDLVVNGFLKSNPIEKKLKIDGSPWCQTISLSLRPFVISNECTLDFWTFRPDTLQVYKLRALKVSVDVLKINSQPIKAQKVKISLTGILSVFGECYYWFRKEDGVLLLFSGFTIYLLKQHLKIFH